MLTGSPLVSLLPSREKVAPKGSDEGAHRSPTQPVAAASSQLTDLSTPHPSLRATFSHKGRREPRGDLTNRPERPHA